jgi:hypothetical protein
MRANEKAIDRRDIHLGIHGYILYTATVTVFFFPTVAAIDHIDTPFIICTDKTRIYSACRRKVDHIAAGETISGGGSSS